MTFPVFYQIPNKSQADQSLQNSLNGHAEETKCMDNGSCHDKTAKVYGQRALPRRSSWNEWAVGQAKTKKL